MSAHAYLKGLLCLLLAVLALVGQVSNGRMEGTVQDQSGSVVADAEVSIQNERTGIVSRTRTDAAGQFQVPALPSSVYVLTVEAKGFRKAEVRSIELNAGVTWSEVIRLEVGSTTESITVEATAVRVNTTDAQIGRTVTTREIDTLPMIGRNPMSLIPYSPGVSIDPGDGTFSRVNGTRQNSNNTRLDGIDANDAVTPRLGLAMTAFNVDSIEEFRVVTNGGKAEYGRNAGGQVEMVTRAGTNTWHGNGYEFLRNTALNSSTFFANSSGLKKPKFNQNNYGASIGGPIQKNKLFVFGNWQGFRQKQEVVRNRTVPTAEAKRGIFRWRTTPGGAINEFDIARNDPRGLGIDPAMRTFYGLYPEPNNTDVGDGLNSQGFRFNNPVFSNNDQFTIKTDYQLASTHRVFYRHSWFKTDSTDNLNNADAVLPGRPQGTQGGTRWGFSIGSDWVIRPTWINELRVGYASASVEFRRPDRPQGPGIITNTFTDAVLLNFGQGRNSPVIDVVENLTHLHGKHTFKGGFVFRRTLQYGFNEAGIYPNLSLTTANNNAPPLTVGPAGLSAAERQRFDWLYADVLGRVGSTTATFYSDLEKFQALGTPRVRNTYFRDYSGFFQDDWKAASNLTLNVGVRYEIFGAPIEANRLQGTLDKIGQLGYSSTFQDVSIQRTSGWYNTDRNNFAPRFGFAWDPFKNGKTSVRGGWGMYYDRMVGSTASLVDGNTPGFAQAVTTFPNSAAGSDVRLRDNPALPAVTGVPLTVPPANRQTSVVVFKPDLATGYVQHFNVTIQREIARNAVIDVGWIRTKGVKMFNWVDLNQPRIYGDFLQSARELQAFQANPAIVPSASNTLVRVFGTPQAAIASLGAGTLQQSQAATLANNLDRLNFTRYAAAGLPQTYLRNYPQFNQVIYGTQDGRSWYDSMQVSFRRQAGALKFSVNYTWSKSIDNTSVDGNGFTAPIDNFNMQQNVGRGAADRPHIVNWTASYTLPFGKGQRWGSNWGGVVDSLLGGWDLGTLGNLQSGSVFTISSNRLTGPSGQATWINYNGDRNIGAIERLGNGVRWLSEAQVAAMTATSAFPGLGEFGTSGRNAFRGPRFLNADAALSKRFALPWEGHRVTLRFEMYNIPNKANFGLPNALITTPATFGRVTGTIGNQRLMQAALRYDF